MLHLFCKLKHGGTKLCFECNELYNYAELRLQKCPYGKDKPECKDCKIHCYNEEMRKRMKEVMKFTGPRMLIYHPTDFLKHLISKKY